MTIVMGYASRRSVRAGEPLDIKVSVEDGDRYEVQLVCLIAPDVGGGPNNPAFRADPVESAVNGSRDGRMQALKPGSYVEIADPPRATGAFTIALRVHPTLLTAAGHALVSTLNPSGDSGFEVGLDANGQLVVRTVDATWESGLSLTSRLWSAAVVTCDPATGHVAATVRPLPGHRIEADVPSSAEGRIPASPLVASGVLRLGAGRAANGGAVRAFNGKLERVRWLDGWAGMEQREALCDLRPDAPSLGPAPLADWDFSRRIDTEDVEDVSGNGRHGTVHQMPARGVAGSIWDTSSIDWRLQPAHYGAIHFHDDDMIDAGWETDFTLATDPGWPSGAYALRLSTGASEFYVPFILRPPAGTRQSDAVFLVPTCTYAAYANLRVRVVGQWNELIHGRLTVLDSTDMLMLDHALGLSCYDGHTDGSTVLYSGLDRPVTNFRPNGRIYKFCMDLMIVAWAEAAGLSMDMVTDEDLHLEGTAALKGYRNVVTGSHPEYWSTPMLDALERWLRAGGRMMYLGGNGFFWRTAYHPTRPSVVEVRRVGMEQLWTAGAGETVFSTVPEPGGTWAHAGRPPNMIAGVGFITQGFDANSYYRKRADAADPRADFVFDGVPEEIIGDFSALMGGAAGYEIDRYDAALGSPSHTLVLASSENHSNLYDLMVGSIVDVLPSTDPKAPDALRADIVFFETPSGGAVFSVGSIAWCGSLAWNGYDNNVARITENVFRRFVDPAPFEMPV